MLVFSYADLLPSTGTHSRPSCQPRRGIKCQTQASILRDPNPDRVNNHKLVTHCNISNSSDQNVLKGYLAYKLMNIFSNHSFMVQLIEMNYWVNFIYGSEETYIDLNNMNETLTNKSPQFKSSNNFGNDVQINYINK